MITHLFVFYYYLYFVIRPIVTLDAVIMIVTFHWKNLLTCLLLFYFLGNICILRSNHKSHLENKKKDKKWKRINIFLIIYPFVFYFDLMDIQRYSFTFVAYEGVLPLCVLVNRTFISKLFDVFFSLVFDHEGWSPSTLTIRDLPVIGSKSQFR